MSEGIVHGLEIVHIGYDQGSQISALDLTVHQFLKMPPVIYARQRIVIGLKLRLIQLLLMLRRIYKPDGITLNV